MHGSLGAAGVWSSDGCSVSVPQCSAGPSLYRERCPTDAPVSVLCFPALWDEDLGFPLGTQIRFCAQEQHSSPAVGSVVLVLNLHLPKGMVLRT